MNKTRIIGLILAIVCTCTIPVLAYMYRTEKQLPSGIVVRSPTLEIGIYWDTLFTEPVIAIDFGEIPQPNYNLTMTKRLYIRNEGDVDLIIHWNSSMQFSSDEIVETWTDLYYQCPLNVTFIEFGRDHATDYSITIPKYSSIGTFNWTLTVWGVY